MKNFLSKAKKWLRFSLRPTASALMFASPGASGSTVRWRRIYQKATNSMFDTRKTLLQMSAKIGANTAAAVEAMLTGCKVARQDCKTCMALLTGADTVQRLESACVRLQITRRSGRSSVLPYPAHVNVKLKRQHPFRPF